MKRLWILVLIIGLSSTPCVASPFLVSDPSQDGATQWKVEIDGTESQIFDGDTVHYDLQDVSVGDHVVKAKFCNEWDCSEWSADFPFERPGKPGPPINLRLSK